MDAEKAALHRRLEEAEAGLVEAKRRLAEVRSGLPPEPFEDVELAGEGGPVRLSDLFRGGEDLLLVHSMGVGCPYCTLWADGFQGVLTHLEDRTAFALCSEDSLENLVRVKGERGWGFPVVSAAGTTFTADAAMKGGEGESWPGVSAFRRREDGSVVRTGRAYFGPHDDFCSVWHLFDLLEGGAGGWQPRLAYGKEGP